MERRIRKTQNARRKSLDFGVKRREKREERRVREEKRRGECIEESRIERESRREENNHNGFMYFLLLFLKRFREYSNPVRAQSNVGTEIHKNESSSKRFRFSVN